MVLIMAADGLLLLECSKSNNFFTSVVLTTQNRGRDITISPFLMRSDRKV